MRAERLGFLCPRALLPVPPELRARTATTVKSLALHDEHNRKAGREFHFARHATLAVKTELGPKETSSALAAHRAANKAKHDWADPLYAADPWAEWRGVCEHMQQQELAPVATSVTPRSRSTQTETKTMVTREAQTVWNGEFFCDGLTTTMTSDLGFAAEAEVKKELKVHWADALDEENADQVDRRRARWRNVESKWQNMNLAESGKVVLKLEEMVKEGVEMPGEGAANEKNEMKDPRIAEEVVKDANRSDAIERRLSSDITEKTKEEENDSEKSDGTNSIAAVVVTATSLAKLTEKIEAIERRLTGFIPEWKVDDVADGSIQQPAFVTIETVHKLLEKMTMGITMQFIEFFKRMEKEVQEAKEEWTANDADTKSMIQDLGARIDNLEQLEREEGRADCTSDYERHLAQVEAGCVDQDYYDRIEIQDWSDEGEVGPEDEGESTPPRAVHGVRVGGSVQLHGLRAATMNGKRGVVVSLDVSRAGVLLHGEARPVAVKFENIASCPSDDGPREDDSEAHVQHRHRGRPHEASGPPFAARGSNEQARGVQPSAVLD